MNRTKYFLNFKKVSISKYDWQYVICSFLLIFTLLGCEDDPILEPSSDSDSDGGSYGNLSLPDEVNDNPDENDSNPYIY